MLAKNVRGIVLPLQIKPCLRHVCQTGQHIARISRLTLYIISFPIIISRPICELVLLRRIFYFVSYRLTFDYSPDVAHEEDTNITSIQI